MAYAALVSVLHITEQMLNPGPYSIPCRKKQIESLHGSIHRLLSFLETNSHFCLQTLRTHTDHNKGLGTKIRDAAYEVEDILESYIANHFLQDSESDGLEKMCRALEEVMEKIAAIETELKKTHVDLPEPESFTVAGSSRPISRGRSSMVGQGLDGGALMMQIMERLDGHHSRLQVIPIIGMGGIGKTTLATTLFDNQLIVEKFDIRVWVTISQEYRVQDVVSHLLEEIKRYFKRKDVISTVVSNKEKIKARKGEQEELHKTLYGRRYLVVLDDVWNTKAWDDLKLLFPDNENRSRIMLTTRHKEVASYAGSLSSYHEMKLLDEDMSWNLLCRKLFAQGQCPSKLEEIGKEIAKNCRGLPLAVVVIAGLLSTQKMAKTYWEYVAENVNSVLAENDEQCLDILSLSYDYLPHQLKACFLYMGVFPEDHEIPVSKLIKLWVAEGFLKPVSSKSLEEVAMESLKDLIDRNLILILRHRPNGELKTCRIHDLLREICLREAQKEKFLYVLNRYIPFHPKEANNQRRLSIHPSVIEDEDDDTGSGDDDGGSDANSSDNGDVSDNDDDSSSGSSSSDETEKNDTEVLFNAMRSMPFTRSFISPASFPLGSEFKFGSGLLRVFEVEKESSKFPKEILKQINLRYVALDHLRRLPSSVCRLWNLQTLIASDLAGRNLPSGIWDMTQLRHLQIGNCHLHPPKARGKNFRVLRNLRTLSGVMNFRCTEKVLARIPNLQRLKISYDYETSDWSKFCLNNLELLTELVSLSCLFDDVVPNGTLVQKLAFPSSLKKLTLRGCRISWEHMTIIGVLPNLEVLKLEKEAFQGPEWEPTEEEFVSLKYLLIENPVDLQYWRAEYTHFRCLQHLVLRECSFEIPSGIGEIAQLNIIELYQCSSATEFSAKEIQEENNEIRLNVHQTKDFDDGSYPSSEYSSSSDSSSSGGLPSPTGFASGSGDRL